MRLTGKIRYRTQRRWTKILLVLQVEVEEASHTVEVGADSYGGGREVVVPSRYYWKDASVEDMLVLASTR